MNKLKLVRELLNQSPFNKMDGFDDISSALKKTKNFPSNDPETADLQLYKKILTIYNKLTLEQQLELYENRNKPKVKKLIEFLRKCQDNISDETADIFADELTEDFALNQRHRKKTGL